MKQMEWLGEKVDKISVGIGEERACCANCNYFYQHYIYNERSGRYEAICFGHCTATKRTKDRNGIDYCPMFMNRKGGARD